MAQMRKSCLLWEKRRRVVEENEAKPTVLSHQNATVAEDARAFCPLTKSIAKPHPRRR